MRVLFLDVDGVLNNSRPKNDFSIYFENCYPAFDDICVKLIKRLVEEEKLTIVLSSAWREYGWATDSLKRFLKLYDLEIFDRTPIFPNMRDRRGWEIQEWLARHPDVKEYVIIDDINNMGNLSGKLVQTDERVGFVYRDFLKAKEILRKEKNGES
jgi:hypothetical protein